MVNTCPKSCWDPFDIGDMNACRLRGEVDKQIYEKHGKARYGLITNYSQKGTGNQLEHWVFQKHLY